MPKSQKISNSRKQLSKKSKRSKKSKKQKRSRSKSNGIKSIVRKKTKASPQENANKLKVSMNDSKLTALCMSCFRNSNKKVRQSVVSTNGRVSKITKNGRPMILGKCTKCDGKMAKLL